MYPALAWNITLTLARELVAPEQKEDLLGKLSTLPWFRHGSMPDWLRVRLLGQLGIDEPKVRAALRRYLDQTIVQPRDKKQEALDIVPGKPRVSSRGKLALHDHVYLHFASGRRLDQHGFAVEALPANRRKFPCVIRFR